MTIGKEKGSEWGHVIIVEQKKEPPGCSASAASNKSLAAQNSATSLALRPRKTSSLAEITDHFFPIQFIVTLTARKSTLLLLQGNPRYSYCKEIHVTLTARKSMLLLLQGNPRYSYCKEIHVTLTARKSMLLLLQGNPRYSYCKERVGLNREWLLSLVILTIACYKVRRTLTEL